MVWGVLRGCCGCRSSPVARRALQHVYLFVRSAVALLSAIICWLGVWEILDLYLWEKTVARDVLYVICSAILLMACDTYLPNCGIYEEDSGDAAKEAAAQQATVLAVQSETETAEEAAENAALNAAVLARARSSSRGGSGRGSRSHSVTDMRAGEAHEGDVSIDLSPTSGALAHPAADPSSSHLPHHQQHQQHLSELEAVDPSEEERPLHASEKQSYARACSYLLHRLCSWRVFFRVYVASLVSLFASIAFWTGAYNLLLELFLEIAHHDAKVAYTLNLVLGWVLMWMTGTLFTEAGLDESEPSLQGMQEDDASARAVSPRAHWMSRLRVYSRATLAITGTMMFWLGASMLLEEWSQLYYEYDAERAPPSKQSQSAMHCHECIESTPARNAVLVMLGFVCFILTDTMAVHAGVEDSINHSRTAPEIQLHPLQQQQMEQAAAGSIHDTERLEHVRSRGSSSGSIGSGGSLASSDMSGLPSPRPSRCARFLSSRLMQHVRALISLWGVIMVWEGIWDAAFTAEAEAAGWGRMVIFMVFGLLGLQVTDSLFSNAGVVPPFVLAKRSTQVQQRLGFHLQEQVFVRAAAGGQLHDSHMINEYNSRHPHPPPPPPSDASASSHQVGDLSHPSPSSRFSGHRGGSNGVAASSASFHALSTSSEGTDMAPSGSRPQASLSPVLTPPRDAATAIHNSKAHFSALEG